MSNKLCKHKFDFSLLSFKINTYNAKKSTN